MRLDQELVLRKLSTSRQEAQELIIQGFVLVNNVITTKQTKKVSDQDGILVTGKRQYVSRGGNKLEGALLHIYGGRESTIRSLKGKNALDVGSSTGGFTDCLLQHRIATVTAVDVGTAQLHPTLAQNKNVHSFENTDIRSFDEDVKFDVVVCDLSFISLEKIIDRLLSLGKKDTEYFLLIKPQFEVGKGNTKKGIVKDDSLITQILDKYDHLLKTTEILHSISLFPSSIVGGDGNKEYFIYCVHS